MSQPKPKRTHAWICTALFLAILAVFFVRFSQGSDTWTQSDTLNTAVQSSDGSEVTENTYTLTLEPAEYEAVITYSSSTDAVVNVYSPKYVNSDNQSGKSFAYYTLPAGENQTFSMGLSVDKQVSDCSVYITTTGEFTLNTISVSSIGALFSDHTILIWLFAAIAVFGSFLILCRSNAKRLENWKSFFTFIILALLAAGVSVPMLTSTLNNALYQDLSYHLPRIEGLAEAIKTQSFPYRIHGAEFGYYGQAEGVFYPEVFLLIPAGLRALGMSLFNSFRIAVVLVNVATVLVSYTAFRHLFSSRRLGIIGSVLYTCSIYRLMAVYVRMAMGAYTAMIFLPLVVWGFYEVFFRDSRKWWLLTISVTCILQSHLITMELTLIVCVIFFFIFFRYLWKDKKRLAALGKAMLFAVLLNLWWVIPFLDYSLFGVGALGNKISLQEPYITDVSKLWAVTYPLLAGDQMPFSVGLLLAVALVGYFVLLLIPKYRHRPEHRYALPLAICSLLFCWMATVYFPWDSCALFQKLGSTLQFAFRTLEMVTILTVILTLLILKIVDEQFGHTKIVSIAVVLVSGALSLVILVGYRTIPEYADKNTLATYDSDSYMLDGWYLPSDTDIYDIYYDPGTVKDDNDAVISNFTHSGTDLSFDFSSDSGGTYELPMLYYPGYQVQVNGTVVEIEKDDRNLISFTTDETSGHVEMKYTGKLAYRIGDLVDRKSVV